MHRSGPFTRVRSLLHAGKSCRPAGTRALQLPSPVDLLNLHCAVVSALYVATANVFAATLTACLRRGARVTRTAGLPVD
jgi:hypothetical protein